MTKSGRVSPGLDEEIPGGTIVVLDSRDTQPSTLIEGRFYKKPLAQN